MYYCKCGFIECGCVRSCTHIPMRDNFVSARAHATAQRAFDIPAVLEKNKILRFQCNYEQVIRQYCNNGNVLFSLSSTYFNSLGNCAHTGDLLYQCTVIFQ